MYSHPRGKKEEEEAIFQFNYLFFIREASDLWETIFGGRILLPFPHFLLAFLWHIKGFYSAGAGSTTFPPRKNR